MRGSEALKRPARRGTVTMEKEKNGTPPEPGESGKDSLALNIGKILFLLGALAAAWFLLDWLIGSK